jgi:2,3-bisphosphoglycerate-dependent phosphoglycerate mutase
MIHTPDDAGTEDLDAATRVTLIRHGRTAWNAATRIQGQIDIELDHVGRWQADCVADALGDAPDVACLYASDLGRARDTALPLARALGVELHLDAALRERHFGAFEGLTFADIDAFHADQAHRWKHRDPVFAPEGGESLREFHDRAIRAVTKLAMQHAGQHIVIVSHGGVLDAMYRAGSKIDISARRTWHIGNASIHRMLLTQAGWMVVGWNDEFHLQAPMPGEDANAFVQSRWPEDMAAASGADAEAVMSGLRSGGRRSP